MNDRSVSPAKSYKDNMMPLDSVKKGNRKIILVIAILSIVMLATIWIWKNIQINDINREAERKNELLREETSSIINKSHKTYLKLFVKPYAWAIRSELLTGNIKQVNLYSNEMVKEEDVLGVIVSNGSGVIISSTNKKNEGNSISGIAPSNYEKSDSIIVETINDSTLLVVSPIMGFNNRLGTLMITYRVRVPAFKSIEGEL